MRTKNVKIIVQTIIQLLIKNKFVFMKQRMLISILFLINIFDLFNIVKFCLLFSASQRW